ncbi:MAG: hypothetical protein PVI78_03490 [Anaerolineales bacterium]
MRDSAFWGVTVPKLMNLYASTIFALLWIGFIVALIVNQDWLNMAWVWTQSLPLVLRILAWVILTPVMVLLWSWQSSWPLWGRLAVFAGLIGWTLIAVFNFIKTFR